MRNNKLAKTAFAITLGAVLTLGTVPAFAYAAEADNGQEVQTITENTCKKDYNADGNNKGKESKQEDPNTSRKNYDADNPNAGKSKIEQQDGNQSVKDYNADSDNKGKESTITELTIAEVEEGNTSKKDYNADNAGDKIDRGVIVDGNQSGKKYDVNKPGQNN